VTDLPSFFLLGIFVVHNHTFEDFKYMTTIHNVDVLELYIHYKVEFGSALSM
jgi:hypothetical protein